MDSILGLKDYISFGVICASGIGAVFYTVSLGFDCLKKARQYAIDKRADAIRKADEECARRRQSGECPLAFIRERTSRPSIENFTTSNEFIDDKHNP